MRGFGRSAQARVCRASEIPFTGRIKSPEIYPRLAEPKHSEGYVSIDKTRAQMDSYAQPPAERKGGGLVGKKKKNNLVHKLRDSSTCLRLSRGGHTCWVFQWHRGPDGLNFSFLTLLHLSGRRKALPFPQAAVTKKKNTAASPYPFQKSSEQTLDLQGVQQFPLYISIP